MSAYPQLFLDSSRRNHFDGRHPWVLANSVVEPTIPLAAGQVVDLLQTNGNWIGRGVYNPNSKIRVRLYQWTPDSDLDEAWLEQQLRRAVELREQWQTRHGALQAVRLVNSEGDGLSGLIVDQFQSYLIVQITSFAAWQWREAIVNWFQVHLKASGVLVVVDTQVGKQEGVEPCSNWYGDAPSGPLPIREHDVQLQVDLLTGQKTGYYLDQRQNRVRAARWMPDGGKMLDVCCYQGGFSLAACAIANPSHVLAVDSSERALQLAADNAAANGFSQIQFHRADCFDYLKELATQDQTFDSIVLDPPRMAGTRNRINAALRAYHRLNLSALQVLKPGGILVTCSCSGRVSLEEFQGVISSAGKRARRNIQVLETLAADFDHPYLINCPETNYLKCLICRVD